jgi:hypothetical protein
LLDRTCKIDLADLIALVHLLALLASLHERHQGLEVAIGNSKLALKLLYTLVARGDLARQVLELLLAAQTVLLRRAAVNRATV